MAAKLVTNISRHIGTAAERATMSTTGLLLGSEFMETDTGLRVFWDGSSWASFQGVHIADPSDTTRVGEFDTVFQIPVTIDVAHHEIHEGDSFHCCGTDTELADEATLILTFKTPAGTKRVHMLHSFVTLTGGHLEILEGATWTNQTGTKQPIFNRKREASMNNSGILEDQAQAGFVASNNMILNPDSVAGGTAIHTHYAYGAKNFYSGQGRELEEFILKPATQYAFKFTADAAANAAQMMLNFYEHTDE